MPRDLPLGNGSLLIGFDSNYRLRDLYWPHVGQENHSLGHPFRLGFWVQGEFRWMGDEGWNRDLQYEKGTLVSQVAVSHPELAISANIADTVDFHENLFLRKFVITNDSKEEREIRIFFHHDFHVGGHEVGDTAYYEPERRAVIHYKGSNWFLINGAVLRDEIEKEHAPKPRPGEKEEIVVGLHQWACGLKEIHDYQGTWRDAENGQLSGDAVAHGSVDSSVGFNLNIRAGESRRLYYWMAVGADFESVARINRLVRVRGPEAFLDRTRAYWNLWLERHVPDYADLPDDICRSYEDSLLILRTQIDNSGAVLAANDTDITSMVRDTYSYMWPRDGALVTRALIQAGYLDLSRAFFQFCARVLTKEGYLLHKYNPDGTLASSWHPWIREGTKTLPIQEDETALVLWVLWEHFERFGDVEFIKPLYRKLITPIADFLTSYRSTDTGLPLPSYDLWEERYGILTWTVAATWGGLMAGARFADAFGDMDRGAVYRSAAEEMKSEVENHLWLKDKKRFARMIPDNSRSLDDAVDSSLSGLWMFGMYAPDHPKIITTVEAIKDQLSVKTEVGGFARYKDDRYHQISQDIEQIPGNPWFICTLWLADWHARTATSDADLEASRELLAWASERALPSSVLAEQVHPHTNAPLSVSPLTWSHATFISSAQAYLAARRRLA